MIIKLLPCLVLTVISFILINVLCQAAKRKVKLKGYNQSGTMNAANANVALNGQGHRYDSSYKIKLCSVKLSVFIFSFLHIHGIDLNLFFVETLSGAGTLQPNLISVCLCRPSKCQRRTDRTTMLLVAVLLLFLITEFPQGILGLLSGILEKCFFKQCYNKMGEMMDLLALINAAVGFVLYGLMSKQFRTSFKSVFFQTRLSSRETTRVTNINNTTCV